MKKKILTLISGLLLISNLSYAAWPSVSARTKTWGAEVLTAADLHGQFDIIHTYINAMMNGSTGHGHTGTTNDGPKLNLAAALTIASQAQGDVIYASSGSAFARLGAGTTGQFLKTNGASANPSWASVVVTNYRREMHVSQASTTTMTVSPGEIEVGGNSVATTANTTLTLTTAGNWAGGVSQQATSTTGYVIVDSSGNFKLTTTAPAFADYAVSVSAANNTKRYATVSAVVYRYLGWFRMNATGSGQLDTYGVSDLADMDTKNIVTYQTGAVATGTATTPKDDTIPQFSETNVFMSLNFRPTNVNNKLRITVTFCGTEAGTSDVIIGLWQDSGANALTVTENRFVSGDVGTCTFSYEMKAATIGNTLFQVGAGEAAGSTVTFNGSAGSRRFGGVMASSIKIEEIPSQLT